MSLLWHHRKILSHLQQVSVYNLRPSFAMLTTSSVVTSSPAADPQPLPDLQAGSPRHPAMSSYRIPTPPQDDLDDETSPSNQSSNSPALDSTEIKGTERDNVNNSTSAASEQRRGEVAEDLGKSISSEAGSQEDPASSSGDDGKEEASRDSKRPDIAEVTRQAVEAFSRAEQAAELQQQQAYPSAMAPLHSSSQPTSSQPKRQQSISSFFTPKPSSTRKPVTSQSPTLNGTAHNDSVLQEFGEATTTAIRRNSKQLKRTYRGSCADEQCIPLKRLTLRRRLKTASLRMTGDFKVRLRDREHKIFISRT